MPLERCVASCRLFLDDARSTTHAECRRGRYPTQRHANLGHALAALRIRGAGGRFIVLIMLPVSRSQSSTTMIAPPCGPPLPQTGITDSISESNSAADPQSV